MEGAVEWSCVKEKLSWEGRALRRVDKKECLFPCRVRSSGLSGNFLCFALFS